MDVIMTPDNTATLEELDIAVDLPTDISNENKKGPNEGGSRRSRRRQKRMAVTRSSQLWANGRVYYTVEPNTYCK